MAHLSYEEYIDAGNEPGLTNYVKYNWLSSGGSAPSTGKYLVIRDLSTWIYEKVGGIKVCRAITGLGLANAKSTVERYIAAGITDSHVQADRKVAADQLPDTVNTVDEAIAYLQTIYSTLELTDSQKAAVTVSTIDDSIQVWFSSFLQ